jgi:hypothetical protein
VFGPSAISRKSAIFWLVCGLTSSSTEARSPGPPSTTMRGPEKVVGSYAEDAGFSSTRSGSAAGL